MTIKLEKGSSINLTKTTDGLNHIFVGLGWAPAKKQGGFLSIIFGEDQPDSIDLDASAILLDKNKDVLDLVWFRNLQNFNSSVAHSGDNLTGEGDGDDEVISVNLAELDEKVDSIVFTVCSYKGQTFDEVQAAYCRAVNKDNNVELCKYVLSEGGHYTGYIMAKLYKNDGAWALKAIGLPCNGRTVEDLVPMVQGQI